MFYSVSCLIRLLYICNNKRNVIFSLYWLVLNSFAAALEETAVVSLPCRFRWCSRPRRTLRNHRSDAKRNPCPQRSSNVLPTSLQRKSQASRDVPDIHTRDKSSPLWPLPAVMFWAILLLYCSASIMLPCFLLPALSHFRSIITQRWLYFLNTSEMCIWICPLYAATSVQGHIYLTLFHSEALV